MSKRGPKLLLDIAQAAESALEFTRGRTFEDYVASLLIRSAVERQLTIVGEATAQLRRIEPKLADGLGDVQAVVAFRNILIHGYETVDHAIVWRILKNDLPQYVTRARTMLGSGTRPSGLA